MVNRNILLVAIILLAASCSTIELTTIQFKESEYRPVTVQYVGEDNGERN